VRSSRAENADIPPYITGPDVDGNEKVVFTLFEEVLQHTVFGTENQIIRKNIIYTTDKVK
jgi:hypothetical protein